MCSVSPAEESSQDMKDRGTENGSCLTLARCKNVRRDSHISSPSRISAYFLPVGVQAHALIFEILRYIFIIYNYIYIHIYHDS